MQINLASIFLAKDNPSFFLCKSAVNYLTEVAQDMTIGKMSSAQMAAIHAKRITMLPKDMQLVDKILG